MDKIKERIRFRDLSLPLKLAVIGGTFVFYYMCGALILGFFMGLLGFFMGLLSV